MYTRDVINYNHILSDRQNLSLAKIFHESVSEPDGLENVSSLPFGCVLIPGS